MLKYSKILDTIKYQKYSCRNYFVMIEIELVRVTDASEIIDRNLVSREHASVSVANNDGQDAPIVMRAR